MRPLKPKATQHGGFNGERRVKSKGFMGNLRRIVFGTKSWMLRANAPASGSAR
jgi:hypothetical protein